MNNNLSSPNNKQYIGNILSDINNYSLVEKYKFIMALSLNDNKDEVEFKCKEILLKIDLNIKQNYIIGSDILSIISKYNLTKLIPDLKKLKNKIKQNNFLKYDFDSIIKYLEEVVIVMMKQILIIIDIRLLLVRIIKVRLVKYY